MPFVIDDLTAGTRHPYTADLSTSGFNFKLCQYFSPPAFDTQCKGCYLAIGI